MATVHGMRLDLIDLGGGLGIPYDAWSPELDIDAVGAGLSGMLAEHPWFRGQLLLEPGRWLSGPTGVFLTRVGSTTCCGRC
jgi:diaminopimelate decarboxylase